MGSLCLERTRGSITCSLCNHSTYNKYELICFNCMGWLHISDKNIKQKQYTKNGDSFTVIYTLTNWQNTAKGLYNDINRIHNIY